MLAPGLVHLRHRAPGERAWLKLEDSRVVKLTVSIVASCVGKKLNFVFTPKDLTRTDDLVVYGDDLQSHDSAG